LSIAMPPPIKCCTRLCPSRLRTAAPRTTSHSTRGTPLNPINRALPQLNPAHHLTLLPSLLLLDPLASPIVAGVAGIASSKPPVPGGCSRRFEPPQAPPPVPVASAPSPTLPRTSPPTAGALVRPPTP
jgi:hypothetical protein